MTPPRQPISIASLAGVWSRRSIWWPDDREDSTTRVWWVQGLPWFADLRLPANRPDFTGIGRLADCTIAQRNWLASVQGFAGQLNPHQRAWLWRRDLDFQPDSGKRDLGTLQYADPQCRTMTEVGVDEPYLEIWDRIDAPSSSENPLFTARFETSPGRLRGLLVATARHFLLATDNRTGTGSADPLDMEISHGIRAGSIHEWTITDSSHPWREGKKLFPRGATIDLKNQTLLAGQRWQLMPPPGAGPAAL
jgi:hypothetical protein